MVKLSELLGRGVDQDLGAPIQLGVDGVKMVNAANSPITAFNTNLHAEFKVPIIPNAHEIPGYVNDDEDAKMVTGLALQFDLSATHTLWNEDTQSAYTMLTPGFVAGYGYGIAFGDDLLVLSMEYAYKTVPSLEEDGEKYKLGSKPQPSLTFGAKFYQEATTSAAQALIEYSTSISDSGFRESLERVSDLYSPLDQEGNSFDTTTHKVALGSPKFLKGTSLSGLSASVASTYDPDIDHIYRVFDVKGTYVLQAGRGAVQLKIANKHYPNYGTLNNSAERARGNVTSVSSSLGIPKVIGRLNDPTGDSERITAGEMQNFVYVDGLYEQKQVLERVSETLPGVVGAKYTFTDLEYDDRVGQDGFGGNYNYDTVRSGGLEHGVTAFAELNIPVGPARVKISGDMTWDLSDAIANQTIPGIAEKSLSLAVETPIGYSFEQNQLQFNTGVQAAVNSNAIAVEYSLEELTDHESFIKYWPALSEYMVKHEITSITDFNSNIRDEFEKIFKAELGYSFDEFMVLISQANTRGLSIADTKESFAPAFATYIAKFATTPDERLSELNHLFTFHDEKGEASFRGKYAITFEEYPKVVEWSVVLDKRVEDLNADDMKLYVKAAKWVKSNEEKTFADLPDAAAAEGETLRVFVTGL